MLEGIESIMLAYAHVLMESIMSKISLVPRPPPILRATLKLGGLRLGDVAIAPKLCQHNSPMPIMVTKSNS